MATFAIPQNHISFGNCFIVAIISRNFQSQIITQKGHFGGGKKIKIIKYINFF